jgi:arylsulfatase A-like enzyme
VRGTGFVGVLVLLVALAIGSAPAASLALDDGTQAARTAAPAEQPSPQPQAPPLPDAPNVVFVVADDQRWDTLDVMPTVRDELATPGVTFSNAFVSNPLCCPSRVSILTGQTSATTGVWRNAMPRGGFEAFDDDTTLASALQGAGYRTALLGKYLQEYPTDGTYVPPGWSEWAATDRAAYYDYTLNVNGVPTVFGATPQDYSTDVLADMADGFIRSTPSYQPLFLFFSPAAPHQPATPAPRHDRAFDDIEKFRPPSFDRIGSGAPPWVRHSPVLEFADRVMIDQLRRDMLGSLLALDDAVGTIVTALRETGRLGETLIVFTSDNGYLWGEHRRIGKSVPYEESIRVPLVIRYDPLAAPGTVDRRFAMNIDLAPTAADLAGVLLPAPDGASLVPMLGGGGDGIRRHVTIEQIPHEGWDVPPYCAVRTWRHAYVQYRRWGSELYDLRRDPYELRNLVGERRQRGTLRSMRRVARRSCTSQVLRGS